jgi:hypothetical protein
MGAAREKSPLILRPMLALNLAEAIVADEEASIRNGISVGRRGVNPNRRKMGENHALKGDGFIDVNNMVLLDGSEEMKGKRKPSVSASDFDHSMRTGSGLLEDQRGVVEIAKGGRGHRLGERPNPRSVWISDGIVHGTEGRNLGEGQTCVRQNPSEVLLSK